MLPNQRNKDFIPIKIFIKNYSELSANLSPMRNHIKFLPVAIFLLIFKGAFAQESVNKGDVIIHIYNSVLFINYKFLMDIRKKGNEVKINYACVDSVKFSEVRKDPEYAGINTLNAVFDRHTAYTTDSVTINLKRDTAYKNLLLRIANASEIELKQNKKRDVLDGDHPNFIIINHSGSKTIRAHAPTPDEMPLLYRLLQSSLAQSKNSAAVIKIYKKFGYRDS